MTIRELAPINILFENIYIKTTIGNNLYFTINRDNINNINKRFQIQNLYFIISTYNYFNIENYINDYDNKYIWYMKGVYSANFADIYYKIVKYNYLINNYNSTKIQKNINNNINRINNILGVISNNFNIKTELEFNNIIEFISSVVFIKTKMNMTEYDETKKFLIRHRKQFKKLYKDNYDKTLRIIKLLEFY